MTADHVDTSRSERKSLGQATLLAQRRVLVIGGGGFLGRHVCDALTGIGAHVSAAVRGDAPAHSHVHYVTADFSDQSKARSVIAETRPDVVFLLASYGVGSPEMAHVLPCVTNDFLTTVNGMAAASEYGRARIVVAASMEEPIEKPAVPGSPYAAAKWAATGFARMFYDLYKAPVVITRPFMTYGPGQRVHKVVPYTILSFLRGESPILSSGRRLVDWVYVDDVVRGLLLAAASPGVEGGEFDLASGKRVSIHNVVGRIRRLTGSDAQPTFGGCPDRPNRRVRRADTATPFARMGWKSEIGLDEGLRRTVEWYRLNAE